MSTDEERSPDQIQRQIKTSLRCRSQNQILWNYENIIENKPQNKQAENQTKIAKYNMPINMAREKTYR